jgi:hypothetical protein
MTYRYGVVLVVALAFVACRGGATKSKRTGSAAPVEIVNQPLLPDAGTGPGPNVDEIEPNDGEEVATPLTLGGTARGKIEGENDADFYRVELDAPGVLQASLSGVDGADLVLELHDATGTVLGRSDRTGVRIREGIPNAGVSAGRYTLAVKGAPKPKKKDKKAKAKKGAKTDAEEAPPPPAPVYELAVQLVPQPAGAEREPDDDRGTANDLIVSDNATGFLGWSDDKDVWKLSVETLSEKNALDIEVSGIEGVSLVLEISDGVGNLLATRKGLRSQPLVMRGVLPVVAPGATPFYYLTVRGDRSNPETAYTLHAKAQVVGPDAELEPNDIVDKAQPIPPDRTVVHAIWTPGDIDCFAIASATTARTVDVSIDTPAEIDLAAELFVDGKVVATANKGGKGVLEKLSAPVPPGAAAIVRVKNPDANASVEAKYDVSVQETTANNDNAP